MQMAYARGVPTTAAEAALSAYAVPQPPHLAYLQPAAASAAPPPFAAPPFTHTLPSGAPYRLQVAPSHAPAHMAQAPWMGAYTPPMAPSPYMAQRPAAVAAGGATAAAAEAAVKKQRCGYSAPPPPQQPQQQQAWERQSAVAHGYKKRRMEVVGRTMQALEMLV
jgi:hypothetical protein